MKRRLRPILLGLVCIALPLTLYSAGSAAIDSHGPRRSSSAPTTPPDGSRKAIRQSGFADIIWTRRKPAKQPTRVEHLDPDLPELLLAMMTSGEIARAMERPIRDWRARRAMSKELEGIAKRNGKAVIPMALHLLRTKKDHRSANRLLHSLPPGDSDAVSLLIDALHESRGWVRFTAASALSRLIRPAAPGRLLELMNHPDTGVRAAAVEAVARSGLYSLNSLPALRKAMDDPKAYVRYSIYLAAKQLKDRPLTAGLFAEKLDVEEGYLRRTILNALAGLDARPWLNRILPLVDDPDASTRRAALAAFAFGGRFPPQTLSLSMAALDDESISMRGTATRILRRYKDELPHSLIPKITRNMETNSSWLAWQSGHLLVEMKAVGALERMRAIEAAGSPNARRIARFVIKRLKSRK